MHAYQKEIPESLSGPQLDHYLERGWYRMRQTLFTTTDIWRENEMAFYRVYWLRFAADEICEHRSHRAIRKKNIRFQVKYEENFRANIEDHFLYFLYAIHTTFDSYFGIDEALYDGHQKDIYQTKAIRVWDGKKLIAVGLFDVGQTAVASILHFYHPEYAASSPGKYLMLLTIDFMRSQGFQWYYPGYVVRGNSKFDYKLFLGKEVAQYYQFEKKQWAPFDDQLLDMVTK